MFPMEITGRKACVGSETRTLPNLMKIIKSNLLVFCRRLERDRTDDGKEHDDR